MYQAAALIKHHHQTLKPILDKIQEINRLNAKIMPLIDETLRAHCQVASYTQRHLVLLAPNGSIATQLHFLIPDLLKQFKKDSQLEKIQTIQCKVQPRSPVITTATSAPKPLPPLSSESAAAIKAIAQSIHNPALKEVLMRIAAHTSKSE